MRAQVDSKCDYPPPATRWKRYCSTRTRPAPRPASRRCGPREWELLGTPRALEAGLADAPVSEPERHEYGCLTCRVDIVTGVDAAVAHVNRHSSGHTDCVVAEDTQIAERFLRQVDSADVFHNASTRFADGFRFGLGAELGIATGRIHARGPVGVAGFLTYKRACGRASHAVADFGAGACLDAPGAAARRLARWGCVPSEVVTFFFFFCPGWRLRAVAGRPSG